jgi:hypothetical protein
MLKWLLVGLALCLPAWCGEHESPAPIALYLDFQFQPAAPVLAALQEEVDVIMAPMGTEFEWRSLKAVTGSEVSVQLAVVKFLGRCETIGFGGIHPLKRNALGWTHVSDGAILPFADIDCDGIRQFLRNSLLSVESKLRPEAYGRAIGRVLAHELYHIFANTAHHGSTGVGTAVYSVQDLLSPEFHFETHESEALRGGRPRPIGEIVDETH